MIKGVFFLRLWDDPASAGEMVSWLDTRDQSHGVASLAEIAGRTTGCRVIALVPARDVTLLQAELPTRGRQRLLQALPYALEEQLAGDVESLHFAVAPRSEPDKVDAAVISKALLQEWLEVLRQAGIEPQSVVPEALLVPWETGTWSLLLTPEAVTLRTATQVAMSLPVGEAEQLVRLTLDQADGAVPKRLVCFDCLASPQLIEALSVLCSGAGIELEVQPEEEPMLIFLRAWSVAVPIELLQGELRRRSRFDRYWKPWRGVAALLVASLLVQFADMAFDYYELRRLDARLTQEIERIYLDTFPETRNLVNPRLQMERHLQALQQTDRGGGFLELLAVVGPVLGMASSLEVEGLRYHESALELDIRIGDFGKLDRIKTALEEIDGLGVKVDAANAEQGMVRSQLHIEKAGT